MDDAKRNTTIGPKNAHDDERIDKAMEDTFPASDPPSHTGITGPAGDVKPADAGQATGNPARTD